MKRKLTGWGNYPGTETEVATFSSLQELGALVKGGSSFIARGCGRSYGDSSLNSEMVLSTAKFRRMISFNQDKGHLVCESGVTLDDILTVFLPRGWFPAVTPGTRFITIGGAIASDVHGKNHHLEGSFSSCVLWFELMTADGNIVYCSREDNPELFVATCGAMGLTGIITRAGIALKQVKTAYIKQNTIKAANLVEVMQAFEDNRGANYSVAWIDCQAGGDSLGRAVLTLGEHAETEDLPAKLKKNPLMVKTRRKWKVPFFLPGFTLNRYTISAFNSLYYRKSGEGIDIIDFDHYFYPLDSVLDWNRIYGRKGFTQYQCVIPQADSHAGISALLHEISGSGMGSFLAVLKLLGEQDGLLSFPEAGYTLALDFPRSRKALALLERLDEITRRYNGRLYLTKDARMSSEVFADSYADRLETFRAIRTQVDPTGKISSLQSERLKI